MNSGTFVKPKGDTQRAKYILVAEQPGRTEVTSGEPLVGPTGRENNECLMAAGIMRAECYLTNFAKDLDNHVSEYQHLGPPITYNEKGKYYLDMLLDEVNSAKTNVIFAIGNHAMAALTNRTGITKWRGSILTDPRIPNKYIIPVIHPSTILPPKNVYLNKFLIQLDYKRGKQIVEKGYESKIRNLIIKPSLNDSMSYLEKCYQEGLKGAIIYFDIEIYNEEISCISFAYNDSEAISIPFVGETGDYFTIEQELQIFRKVAIILEHLHIKKCGQNVSFDTHFLLRRYGIKSVNLEDTMVAQNVIMPDYPKGLDFITSVWTDHPYYKDEGKKYFDVGRGNKLWQYNATDSLICAEAFPRQLTKLTEQGNKETYERQKNIIPSLVYMQERGILCDTEGMIVENKRMIEQSLEAQEELNKLVGFDLNVNSPKQLMKHLYGTLGHTAYMKRGTGNPTTDDTAMKRLARKGVKEAKLIQKIRRLRKISSTYIPLDQEGKLIKIDDDNRIRCSFNPAGTKFSRLSSSENIFGTGTNLQNIPHHLLKYFLFDPNYIGYRVDLAQAENRIVAYVGNVRPMIEAFEGGLDVHKLTAGLIFQKPIDQVTEEDGACHLGDGTHGERFWGKKANHALNYDLGYRTFALYYEIQESEAKFIVDRYHMAYPGVRQGFHTLVRKQLRDNRTVTNLMGRKTLFLDQWGDTLFKEAYSCIPQGTVGDIINERGLSYIYDNQNLFSSIELLLQVHDDITFQIPRSISLLDHARMLLYIKDSLETPLVTFDGREFFISTDITVCPRSLAKEEGTELKSKDISNDPGILARKLGEITA